MLKIFISRPVLSTVISIVIVIMGLVALTSLPIQQFPDIAPPTVEVTASYPGANADVVLNSVIAPLEEKINGVEGMTYMVSSANNDGSATIQVFFSLATDPDMAAVNVQNRVASATSSLPSIVNQMGVRTAKKQNSMVLVLSVASNNPIHDETFIQNYARIYILPELQRIAGVGDVKVFGARDYSMRVWLHPDRLAAYKLQPSDVMRAIQEQSLEVAPGKVGANSKEAFQITVKYKGRLTEVEQYENIVLRVSHSGEILYLKDVATLEFGALNLDIIGRTNGEASVVMAVYQMKGSNSQYISSAIKSSLTKFEPNLPEGMHYDYVMDSQDFLDASIHEVKKTLLEAFLLVFLVVFVFLQNVRATIIPAISVLVALVGTFMFLQIFGFSINMLTLFALVLSIGIVVDDAIVVVEAVYAKLEGNPNLTPLEATQSAMSEITGAVISITLVFIATFLPAVMMTGATGAFYQQFCVTLAIAVSISALNALTLSPALCAIMIKVKKNKNEETEENAEEGAIPVQKNTKFLKTLGDGFNVAFNALVQKYGTLLQKFMNRKTVVFLVFLVIASASVLMLMKTPTAFVPTEDQGCVYFDVSMPEGSSLDRTQQVLEQLDTLLRTIPEVQKVVTVGGSGMLSGALGGSYGLGFIKLVNWEERDTTTLKNIVMQMYELAAKYVTKDATVLFFVPPSVSGYGSSSDIEMQFLDQSGAGDIANMYHVGQEFMEKMNARPEISKTFCSFTVNVPQYELELDVNKAKMMGVSPADVFNTMQFYFGGGVAGDFNKFTKFYRVMVQADPTARQSVDDLNMMFVRNSQGEMAPLSALVTLKTVYGSDLIKRYNMFPCMTINITPAEGYSTSEAMNAATIVSQDLPAGFGYEYSGMTRDELESGGQQLFVFALSFILVFFILSALYESYIVPLSVMLALLLGVFGVYTTINIIGLAANIYVQVAMIMLLGLLAKNAILIVEFGLLKRKQGLSLPEAAVLAAKERVRPILMTSFAFIFGMLPLCLASGAGAAGNISIGISAAGGFLISTILGLLFVPIFFVIFKGLQERMSKK